MVCDKPADEYAVTDRAEQVMDDIAQGNLQVAGYYKDVYFPKIDLGNGAGSLGFLKSR